MVDDLIEPLTEQGFGEEETFAVHLAAEEPICSLSPTWTCSSSMPSTVKFLRVGTREANVFCEWLRRRVQSPYARSVQNLSRKAAR